MIPVLPSDNQKFRELDPKKNNKEQEVSIPEIIRSEVNFLILPFFALWDKDIYKRTKTEYRTVIKRGGQKLELSWIVTSNSELGYPGPFDRVVYKSIEQIIGELPLPIQNPIPLGSLYNLCKRMGISKFGGSQYRKVKKAIERIMATSIISEGTFYYKEKEEWIEDAFHLIDRVIFKGRRLPDGKIADTNYIFLNSWYIDNINAHYVKPIDWSYYKSLATPIAQRLYELLGVKFYGLLMKGGRFISYKYSTLCSLLPITQQKYLSKAKEALDPAHIKLKETDFIEACEWKEISQKGKTGDWLIIYYPGKRSKEEIKRFKGEEQLEFDLPSPKEEETLEISARSFVGESSMTEPLVQRGITKVTARNLSKTYSLDQIQKQIEIFDYLVENKSPLVAKNPAGLLRKSIEENYQLPAEYNRRQEREIIEQKRIQEKIEKEAEQARLDDIQRQVDEYRDSLNDEERQLLRQEALQLIESDKAIKKQFVTEHLIRAKENEVIRDRLVLE